MPSCTSINNLNQYSSRYRCAMRGQNLNHTVSSLLTGKTSYSRAARNQGSIIIEFRRWLVEFWNSVINHLKGVFSSSRNLQTPQNRTSKITNMDLDCENSFWREGGPRYLHKNGYPIIRKKSSNEKNRLENRESNLWLKNRRYDVKNYPVSYKYNKWSKVRRRSTREITNFTTTDTADDEYFALYKKSSHNKQNDKSSDKMFSNSSGDYISEPIETILSRYRRKKSSKVAIERKSESSIDALNLRVKKKSKETLTKSLRSSNIDDSFSPDSNEDDKWAKTNYFSNVWYTKSELNITPDSKRVTRTRNQVSRIPRLRHSPEMRNNRSYCTKNYATSSSICQ